MNVAVIIVSCIVFCIIFTILVFATTGKDATGPTDISLPLPDFYRFFAFTSPSATTN